MPSIVLASVPSVRSPSAAPSPAPSSGKVQSKESLPTPLPTLLTEPECPKTSPPASSSTAGGTRKLGASKKQLARKVEQIEAQDTFDFIVAGFPKCGTTTLLKAFAAHNETDMMPSEKCTVASPGMPDLAVLRKLDEALMELSLSPNVKRSFKCPTAIYTHKTISRMEKHSPGAKFIVGVRHPILMIQSFYNYRVSEIHNRGLQEKIPSFEEVAMSEVPWKGVSLDAARFELFLMQFGKTGLTSDDLYDLVDRPGYQLAIRPSKFKIFLYSLDQMEDEDELRNKKFRSVLQHYLGLSEPVGPFSHENINHQVGDEGYKETIDICQDKYKSVRAQLVQQGRKSADWIRGEFIQSGDIWVANEDHFVATLDSWSVDPCIALATP
jgi:hypothetical protein